MKKTTFFKNAANFIDNKILYNKFLGIRLKSLDKGFCQLYLPFKIELLGDPFRNIIHGGVLSTLIDVSGGAACFSMLKNQEDRLSTIDLRIDFLEPAKQNDLICFAEVVRMGNKICVVHMKIFSNILKQSKNLIATGQGAYNIIRNQDI